MRGRRGLGQLRRLHIVGGRNVARNENAEGRALAELRIHVDETAGLLDDAVDGREPEPGALADILGGVEGVENLVDDLRRDAGAGVLDLDQHIFAERHPLVLERRALLGADIRRAQRELAAVRHGIARIDREIDDHLLELADVGLDRPEVAHLRDVERHVLADQARAAR